MNKSERVQAIFSDCLFRDDEIVNGKPTVQPVTAEAIMATFGFHPDRLTARRAEIVDLLSDFPDEFYTSKGGGWSFLNFCETRDGEQWSGLQTVMEQLLALGLAVGAMKILMPREMWSMFPGGVPYIAINDGAVAEVPA